MAIERLKSGQLDRTLAELESAFAAWDSISGDSATALDSTKADANLRSPKSSTAVTAPPAENEFRNKTRKLLNQLREQLADLSKD